jgi:hypothetical protein
MEERPQLVKRYAVEKPKKQSGGISETIMGYIRKIRTKK